MFNHLVVIITSKWNSTFKLNLYLNESMAKNKHGSLTELLAKEWKAVSYIFLGVGLTLNVISFLFSIPVDGMYELIDQGGLIENLILATIAGAIANYTFWGD